MVRTNRNIIIGLTTFNHEFLQISVTGLARVSKNVTLIIHNDNPCRKLTHRQIRRMGFRGRTHIINTDENVGQIRARVAILDYIRTNKLDSAWFMFANDDDVILNLDAPCIDDNIFAVMGNAVTVGGRLLDVLRIMVNPHDYTPDGVDTVLLSPHISMAGTFVRTKYMLEFGNLLSAKMPELLEIISDVPFVLPSDVIMWHMFLEYMRIIYPTMSPIYMNQTNYLMTKLNNTRYPSASQRDSIVSRAVSIVAAAPRGNE